MAVNWPSSFRPFHLNMFEALCLKNIFSPALRNLILGHKDQEKKGKMKQKEKSKCLPSASSPLLRPLLPTPLGTTA